MFEVNEIYTHVLHRAQVCLNKGFLVDLDFDLFNYKVN